MFMDLPPPGSDLTFTLREEDILGRRRLPVRCRGRYLTYSLRYVGHQLLLSSAVGLLAGDDVRRIWFRTERNNVGRFGVLCLLC